MIDTNTSFRAMVTKFPKVDLPITLGPDIHHIFSKENKPLSESQILTFFIDEGQTSLGEFTEYIPCFQIDMGSDNLGLIIWKADLLTYEYILYTFDKKGSRIATKVIAGTKSDGDTILNRVATVEEEGLILVAEGKGPVGARHFDATDSNTFQLEVLPTGDIVHSLYED